MQPKNYIFLQKSIRFIWTEHCEEALKELKRASDPLLVRPNYNNVFVITTDASDFAIGAVLSNESTMDRPIAFASRTFKRFISYSLGSNVDQTLYIKSKIYCLHRSQAINSISIKVNPVQITVEVGYRKCGGRLPFLLITSMMKIMKWR